MPWPAKRLVSPAIRVAGSLVVLSLIAGCGSGAPAQTTRASAALRSAAKSARAVSGGVTREKVAVPKVVGEPFDRADAALHRRGLFQDSAGFPGSDSSTVMNGCTAVLSQAPAPGTRVPERTTIHVTLGLSRC